jgi:hypothetical protein
MNPRPETMKQLEENVREMLPDIRLGEPKSIGSKSKK